MVREQAQAYSWGQLAWQDQTDMFLVLMFGDGDPRYATPGWNRRRMRWAQITYVGRIMEQTELTYQQKVLLYVMFKIVRENDETRGTLDFSAAADVLGSTRGAVRQMWERIRKSLVKTMAEEHGDLPYVIVRGQRKLDWPVIEKRARRIAVAHGLIRR